METSLGNLAHITYSFKHDQTSYWDFLLSFHTKQWLTNDDKNDRAYVPPLLFNNALSSCD